MHTSELAVRFVLREPLEVVQPLEQMTRHDVLGGVGVAPQGGAVLVAIGTYDVGHNTILGQVFLEINLEVFKELSFRFSGMQFNF